MYLTIKCLSMNDQNKEIGFHDFSLQKKYTLLMITERYYPDIGGVQNHVLGVSRAAINTKNSITIITSTPWKRTADRSVIRGTHVIRLPGRLNFINKWIWYLSNARLINTFDAIIFHDLTFYWTLSILPLIILKKKMVVFHGFESFPVQIRFKILRKIIHFFIRRNICIGDFIQNYYYTKPTKVLYGAIEQSQLFKGNNNNDSNVFRTAPLCFCFVGRLAEDTGIVEYCNSIVELQAVLKNEIRIDIVGDGELKQKVDEILHKGRIEHVLHGWVDDKKKILDIIKKCAIVLSASYLTILDAFSQGKIVIGYFQNELKANYLRGLRNAVGQAPLLCSSSEKFIQLVKKMLVDEIYRKCIICQSNKFIERSTWQDVFNEYIKSLF